MVYQTRKLGLLENLFQTLHNLGSHIVVCVGRVAGMTDPNILARSLFLVRERHPLLQMRLIETASGIEFQPSKSLSVPFRVLTKQHQNYWIEVAEEELQIKFNCSTELLWRVTFLESTKVGEFSEIILTCHHAIADGISCVRFFEDLLMFAEQVLSEQATIASHPRKFLPPVETLLNSQITWRRKAEYIVKKIYQKVYPPKLVINFSASPDKRKTYLITRNLNEEWTSQLKERCHQEQTTVHGALCASLLLAISQIAFPNQPIRVMCDSSVNLRKFCTPVVSNEDFGCFISRVETFHNIGGNSLFWDIAKECKQKIEKSIHNRDPQERIFLTDWLGVNEAFLSEVAQENEGRTCAIAVSNLGQVPSTFPTGKLKLTELYFTTGIHFIGACLWLGAVTLKGQLFLSVSYAHPVVNKATATKLTDATIKALQVAIQPNS